nr:DUF3152 domain-containing protein [Mycolicibacterium insubricum]
MASWDGDLRPGPWRWQSRPWWLRSDLREPLRAQRDPLASGAGRPRANREDRGQFKKQGWLGRFISTYGWRAYALPVLVVVTVIVLYQTVTAEPVQAPVADDAETGQSADIGKHATTIVGAPPRGLTEFDANLPTGKLPDGGHYTTEPGHGTWHIVPGTTDQVGEGTVKVFNYTVEVEDGLDPDDFGGDDAFASMVTKTLADPHSWTHDPRIAFRRVDASSGIDPDFRVSLTSSMTVREGCGYEIALESSCFNPAFHPAGGGEPESRVFINEARWVRGAMPFEGDYVAYRQYLINHEVGHAIGFQKHQPCENDGALAPIMMQQTFSIANDDESKFDPDQVKADGKKCRPNSWPFPIV